MDYGLIKEILLDFLVNLIVLLKMTVIYKLIREFNYHSLDLIKNIISGENKILKFIQSRTDY